MRISAKITKILFSYLEAEALNVLQCRPEYPQIRRDLISIIINLIYELPLELPSDLRLRIFGNYEILEKS